MMKPSIPSLFFKPRNLVAGLFVFGSLGLLTSQLVHTGNAFAQQAAPAQAPAVQVTTAIAASGSVQQTVTGIGNAVALSTVTLHARVDGQLEQVNFEEGQDVRAGQVLARLDPRTYQAQLDQAKAQQAKDAAQLANAEADLQRYEELIKNDATTQQTLDTQRALVQQLRAAVQADAAQVSLAAVQLGYTTITAPISGRLGARLIDPGNIVHAADAGGLVVINQIDPIGVQFTLPEAQFPALSAAIRAGHKRLRVEAIDRSTQAVLGAGELVLVNNQIDTATGTISVKASIPNGQHRLWPGQSVDARLSLSTLSNVVTIPSSGVQRSQKGLFVYVVGQDDTVRLQPVAVAQVEGSMSVISTGLHAGDRVVVDGLYRLVPGARVKEAAAAGAAGVKP